MNFCRKQPSIENCPLVDTVDASTVLRDLCTSLISNVMASTTRGYRVLIKVKEGRFVPTVEYHPLDAWLNIRTSPNAPVSPDFGSQPSEEYRIALKDWIPQITGFLYEEKLLQEEETRSFQDTVAEDAHENLNLDGKIRSLFKSTYTSCKFEISNSPCPFRYYNQADVTSRLFGIMKTPFKVLVETGLSPSLLIIGPTEQNGNTNAKSYHTNEGMIKSVVFFKMLVELFKKIHQGTGQYPMMMTINFGQYESVVARTGVPQCHAHAHVHLTRQSGEKVGWQQRKQIPELYRLKNIEEFTGITEKLQRLSFESRTIERFDVLEARLDSLEARFDSLETRFDSLETRFDSLETRFDSLERKVENINDSLLSLKEGMQILLDRKQ